MPERRSLVAACGQCEAEDKPLPIEVTVNEEDGSFMDTLCSMPCLAKWAIDQAVVELLNDR